MRPEKEQGGTRFARSAIIHCCSRSHRSANCAYACSVVGPGTYARETQAPRTAPPAPSSPALRRTLSALLLFAPRKCRQPPRRKVAPHPRGYLTACASFRGALTIAEASPQCARAPPGGARGAVGPRDSGLLVGQRQSRRAPTARVLLPPPPRWQLRAARRPARGWGGGLVRGRAGAHDGHSRAACVGGGGAVRAAADCAAAAAAGPSRRGRRAACCAGAKRGLV